MKTASLPVIISIGAHSVVMAALVYWGIGTVEIASQPSRDDDPRVFEIRWVPRSELAPPPNLSAAAATPPIAEPREPELEPLPPVTRAQPRAATTSMQRPSPAQRSSDSTAATVATETIPLPETKATTAESPLPASEPVSQALSHSDSEPLRPPVHAQPTLPREPTAELVGEVVVQYPRECRRRGHEGEVVLMLWIDTEGRVTQAEIVEAASCHHMNQAAVATAKTLRYQPARHNGVPIASHLKQRLVFRLKNE